MFTSKPGTPPSFFPFGHGFPAPSTDNTHQHRPSVSSPLSSSPIRPSSSPLSPRDSNTPPRRKLQSSPIRCSSSSASFALASSSSPPRAASASTSKFLRFASRPARPNPLVRRREDAQDGRRRLFLQNVKQRADDKSWERRGGENELLKLEWLRFNRERRHAKNSDLEGLILDAELDFYEVETTRHDAPRIAHPSNQMDDIMLDALEQEERAEMDAIASSLPSDMASTSGRPDSPHFSDDDEYDSIFRELHFTQENTRDPCGGQDMDLS